MQDFLDNIEKKMNFLIQKRFEWNFLDWYYQNGKTLIRDYSIPDQRHGFRPTNFFLRNKMKSK